MVATYTTTANVRDEAQIDYKDLGFQDETQYEDVLDELILYAERIIDNYCKVPSGFFAATGVTVTDEYHDYDGLGYIYLHYYPTTVTTLSVNYLDLTQVPSWIALTKHPAAASDYIPYPEYRHHGKIYIYNRAPPAGFRNIKCTYKAGYTITPKDVTQICNEIVANIVRGILKRRLTPQDVSQIVIAGGDIQAVFAEGMKLNNAQKSLLDTYMVSEVRGRRG